MAVSCWPATSRITRSTRASARLAPASATRTLPREYQTPSGHVNNLFAYISMLQDPVSGSFLFEYGFDVSFIDLDPTKVEISRVISFYFNTSFANMQCCGAGAGGAEIILGPGAENKF